MKVYRILFVENEEKRFEDFVIQEVYHNRLVEFRCNIKEQTYIMVEKSSDEYSSLIDLDRKWKH